MTSSRAEHVTIKELIKESVAEDGDINTGMSSDLAKVEKRVDMQPAFKAEKMLRLKQNV